MAHFQHFYVRLTNCYVGSYDHMNEHRYVFTGRVVPGKVLESGNGYDESRVQLFLVRVPAGSANPRDDFRAIRDTFTKSGCHHEYDCCGCASRYPSVKRVSRREYSVRLTISWNY